MPPRPRSTTNFHRYSLRAAFLLLACGLLSGCLSAPTLNRAVIAYDEAMHDSIAKQLLINIARARYHQPIHFTGVSNIAATFDFRLNAGATPTLTGDLGRTLVPIFGGSVAENPTISIAPIEGEDFTRRLLSPFHEQKVVLLLRQRTDIDLLLRLMAGELRVKHQGGDVPYRNNPAHAAEYEFFRKVVLHLSAIQDANALYAEPLVFERTWTLPESAVSAEGFKSLEQDYFIAHDAEAKLYRLRKPVSGRILITNFDPDTLPQEERIRLDEEADQDPTDELGFDIRPGHPGGEWPIRGEFRLRSFNTILGFLGHTIEEAPEFHVEPDPRTPAVAENPVATLDMAVGTLPSANADWSATTHGNTYAVNVTGPNARWNRESFKLLYQLFQMTVTDVSRAGVPGITIAK
ncbi:MAG: hypothetical protein U0172_13710 [Nitrospiraceae bacterium]